MPNSLNQITTDTSTRYGNPLPHKRRAVFVAAGANVTVNFPLLDNCGAPVDLAPYGAQDLPATPQLRIKEVIGPSSPFYTIAGSVLDPTVGLTSVALPQGVAGLPGVYAAEVGVFDNNNNLAFTNKFYVWVDRGLFAANYTDQGPPQLDEIRNAIADYDPGYNLLLDDFEQDLTNICSATERAIRHWNEAQPPIDQTYCTTDWPAVYRNNLLTGITAYLYTTTAQGYLRSHLPYQAAGVSVDDQNKWQQYLQIGQSMVQQYQEWVKLKKTQLNAENAYTSFGSPYYHMWP